METGLLTGQYCSSWTIFDMASWTSRGVQTGSFGRFASSLKEWRLHRNGAMEEKQVTRRVRTLPQTPHISPVGVALVEEFGRLERRIFPKHESLASSFSQVSLSWTYWWVGDFSLCISASVLNSVSGALSLSLAQFLDELNMFLFSVKNAVCMSHKFLFLKVLGCFKRISRFLLENSTLSLSPKNSLSNVF